MSLVLPPEEVRPLFHSMATGLTHSKVPPVFTAGPGACGKGDYHLTARDQAPSRSNYTRAG